MSVTPPAATPWIGSQDQEYTAGSAATLVDASAVSLADASGVTLADSGVTEVPEPATTWTEDDSQ